MAGDPKNRGAEARARYAAQRNGNNGYAQAEFINVNLSDAENEAKRHWCDNHTFLFELMTEEIENGYRFTFKWDERGNCCACFMQSTDGESVNGGYILAARGGTPSAALRECLFIHRELLQGTWSDSSILRGSAKQADDF